MEEDSNHEFSDEELIDLLKDAVRMKIEEKRKIPKKIQVNRALVTTIKEWMNCFKLIGYDIEGNPVNLTIFDDKLQKSALDHAFMEEIGKFMNSNR